MNYSDRAEYLHFLTSLAGAVLAFLGTALLVVSAARQGDPWKIVSVSVYGASLITLYLASTVYHRSSPEGLRRALQKLDHSAIYLLIAGTYTPFTLVRMRGEWGWTLFGLVWGFAVVGIVQNLLPARWRKIPPLVLYLGMGWLVLVALKPLLRSLPPAGVAWLAAGGVSYTVGVAFFAIDEKYEYAHFIWHLFVLGGSISQFVAILLYVI